MINHIKIFLIPVLIGVMLGACHKKCRKECSPSDLSVYARGFSFQELDTVQISEFADNGAFNQLRKTELKLFHAGSTDSTALGVQIGWFDKHSDWVITMPSAKKSYSISAITDEGKPYIEEDCRLDTYCQNEIATFKINDVERIRTPAYLDR